MTIRFEKFIKSFNNKYVVFILLFMNSIFSQTANIHFNHLSVKDGLSQSTVFSILEDKTGFMWFGTEDGLNRYDGYNFKIFKYDADDSTSISNNFVSAIKQDSSGQIWIGTLRGLCRFNPGDQKFYSYNHFDEFNESYINDIHYDHEKNRIWVASTEKGLSYLDLSTNEIYQFKVDENNSNSLISNFVYRIMQDNKGNFWIGTNLGLQKYDKAKGEFTIKENFGTSVRDFFEDSDGHIWIASFGNGLIRYNPENREVKNYKYKAGDLRSLSSDRIMEIHNGKENKIWVGTIDGGLNLFDKKTEKVDRYMSDAENSQSISGNFIEFIYEDSKGIIWLGNNGDGINIYDPIKEKFKRYQRESNNPKALSDEMIYSIFEDPDEIGKSVWIGTDKGGLNYFNRETGNYTSYKNDPFDPNSISHNSVRKIYKNYYGEIWIGTSRGIMIFDKQRNHFKYFDGMKDQFMKIDVRTIFDDPIQPERYMWIGNTGRGLIRFDRQKKSLELISDNINDEIHLSNRLIRAAYGDSNGIIWIGTLGGGLNKYDPQNKTIKYYLNDPDSKNSISSNIILSIYEDKTTENQVLWLGTTGGIDRFEVETEKISNFTEEYGLPNNVVYGILGDDNGDLWASTNKGITRFNPRDTTFRNYDVYDGLQNNEFNAGAYFKSQNGQMFFGGIAGFNIFHPDSIIENPFIPQIVFTSFKKFDKEVDLGKSLLLIDRIELNYDEDFFSFEFAALNFTAPEKNSYAYKMEGFDRDWIYSGSRRYASYTNLDPGEYKFIVKASNNDGVWNEKGTSLNISISPPPWLTWWAYTLYLVGLGFFVSSTNWIIKNRKNILSLRKKRISHYRLLEQIGKGGIGEVYKSLDVNSKEIVALKLLSSELLHDKENRIRFLQEGKTMKSLNHPNIVRTYEFGETEQQGYIAMEYLSGGTLKKYIEENFPISQIELKRIIEQISFGLQLIHSQGIIHRDIKSANIMLDSEKNIRIMDFGLSRSPLVQTMTTLGTAMGTLGYVAPEQITNLNVDQRTDLFSFGVVIYEMLTKKLPFSGNNEIALIHAIFNTVPDNPSSINKNINFQFDNLVMKLLSKEPSERFESITEFIEEFEKKIN